MHRSSNLLLGTAACPFKLLSHIVTCWLPLPVELNAIVHGVSWVQVDTAAKSKRGSIAATGRGGRRRGGRMLYAVVKMVCQVFDVGAITCPNRPTSQSASFRFLIRTRLAPCGLQQHESCIPYALAKYFYKPTCKCKSSSNFQWWRLHRSS